MKNINWKGLFFKSFPIIIVIIASILSGYILMFNGITSGDDRVFHLAQIEDLYLGFKRGYFNLSTNHTFFGIFALDNYGYYGPFPHYCAAILLLIFSGVGANSIGVYKATIILFTILNGIFAYLFAMEISKKNRIISAICAVFYVFLPYRMFCGICRQAFSETIALSFIPMIFYAAHRIVNDEKYNISPYICLILGSSMMILSHPFTALMTAVFGLIYILCNVYKIIVTERWKRVVSNLAISALLIFLLVGVYAILAIQTQNSGIYRLSNNEVMWTTYQHVADSTLNSATFSGFLNFFWIMGTSYTSNKTSLLIFGLFLYFVCVSLMIISDTLIQKAPNSKYYRYIVDLVAVAIIPTIFFQRGEFYIAIGISYLMFLLISLYNDKTLKKKYKLADPNPEIDDKLYKHPEIYYVTGSLLFSLVLTFIGDFWKIMPPIFYSCQFAWRMFGFLYFFLFYLSIIILSQLKKYKWTYLISSSLACFFVLLSMPLFEKREAYENHLEIFEVADEEWLKTVTYSGAQNEMVPEVFYNNEYKSEYRNSLYSNVRARVRSYSNFIYDIEDYINPVFLTGSGSIQITKLNTPQALFSVNVTSEDALIQFPQFYNDGYYAMYGEMYEWTEVLNVDGLIAFKLPKGEYEMKLIFSRTDSFIAFNSLFYVGLGGVVAYGIIGLRIKSYFRKKALEDAKNGVAKKTTRLS